MHMLCILLNLLITFFNTNSRLFKGRSRYCTCCGIFLFLKKQEASWLGLNSECFLVTSPLSQHRTTSYTNPLMTISLLHFVYLAGLCQFNILLGVLFKYLAAGIVGNNKISQSGQPAFGHRWHVCIEVKWYFVVKMRKIMQLEGEVMQHNHTLYTYKSLHTFVQVY